MTLAECRAEFEAAGIATTEDSGRLLAPCPVCPGEITAHELEGRLEIECANGCDRSRIADELHYRTAPRFDRDERRYDFAELQSRADVDPPYRVNPLAVDGHLTVLAATGGEGKTWLGFAMAAGVAHGSPVAGMECSQGRAVIFDAENGEWVLGSRLKALEAGLPAELVAIYNAEGLRLADEAHRAWMLAMIRAERANLAIIDALRPMAPGVAENDSDDMAPVIIGAKQLARDSGAAVVLFHHRGNDPARAFRGSTVIRDQADIVFVLERDEKDPERRWRRRLWCDKYRIAAEPEDRWLGIRSSKGEVYLTDAAPPEAPPRPPDVQEALRALVLSCVADHPGITSSEVARTLGRRKADVLETLRAAEKTGDLNSTGDKPCRWRVVPTGTGTAPEPRSENGAAGADDGSGDFPARVRVDPPAQEMVPVPAPLKGEARGTGTGTTPSHAARGVVE